jgi:G3E family GTPase
MATVRDQDDSMIELPPRRANPVPLHVVAGLYGSGKSSFIQHQIDHVWIGEKLGVILCEEGLVKLDYSRTQSPRVERLLNACVCCEMAYTFFEVLVALLRDVSVSRIVVEISAQADIRQIFEFIRASHLRDHVMFEPIHVLVDVRNPHMRMDSPAPLIRRLLDQAEFFVLNFHDQEGARPFDTGGRRWMLSPKAGTELHPQ